MVELFHAAAREPGRKAATPALARQLNIRQVLDLLRRRTPLTRAEITRQSGISAPTMSKLLDILERVGLIRELRTAAAGRGRPSRSYALSGRHIQVFGAIIGVKTCRIFTAPLSLELKKQAEREFATPYSYAELQLQFRQFIDAQIHAGKVEYVGLGLCTPGLIDPLAQRVTVSPNIHYLDGTAPALDLAAGYPLRTVTIHEEHALALAEQSAGHTGDIRDFVLLDISEGMGMGIFSGGEHVAGHGGFAGEIGHICAVPDGLPCGCGRRGCFETVATDRALRQNLEAILGRRPALEEIPALLADRSDPRIAAAAEALALHLGRALALIVNLLNPGLILLNSPLLRQAPELLDRAEQQMKAYAIGPSCASCRLQFSDGSRDAGVLTRISDVLLESIVS